MSLAATEKSPAPAHTINSQSTGDIYMARCTHFGAQRDMYAAMWNRTANLRLVVFLAAAVLIGVAVWQQWPMMGTAGVGLVGIFFVLVRRQGSLGTLRRRYEELYRINSEAASRHARHWDELPLRHVARAETGHPYAADIDIFGRASLFMLLDAVSTRMGESTLARWLLASAGPETIRERQQAVAELAPLMELRDELQLRGRLMGDPRPDPEPFLAWAEGPTWLFQRPIITWGARASIVLLWTLVIAQYLGFWSTHYWFLVAAANFVFAMSMGAPIYRTLNRVTTGEKDFGHYAASLALVAGAHFQSPALQKIQQGLSARGTPAHVEMARLHRLTTYMLPLASQLYLVVQALTLWDVHLLAAFERWQIRSGRHAREWLTLLGETEALAALGNLAHDNPGWAFPDVNTGADMLQAQELGHPLIPDGQRVNNSVEVGPPGTFLLVTGSNMSGKSTLLRSIGVNIVLAGAGGPVCAASLTMPPVSLWTSMRVQDSLEQGVSFFMAELMRLKSVVDAAREANTNGERRVFYLLDEILQGTNTAERQIAARRVICYLAAHGALGAVSTHDLTLADSPEMAALAHPVHFVESIHTGETGPQMTFDYKLLPGVATSTNALKLMEIVGLDLEDPES